MNLIYKPKYINDKDTQSLLAYLQSLHPIWEQRFSKNNPPPTGAQHRELLRPVYWLGNWQFACLNYYHPPQGLTDRCMRAEPYPPFLEKLIKQIEALVHENFLERDIPKGWKLNTCLINYYGDRLLEDGKRNDCARVGEHKDFEPGPVASLSFGEKALFQFVSSQGQKSQSQVVLQQWLEHQSLQIFGGEKFKKKLFHRVQRVEKKGSFKFSINEIPDFETRRINLTFRFVPEQHIYDFSDLKLTAQEDVRSYVETLAKNSSHFKAQLNLKLG